MKRRAGRFTQRELRVMDEALDKYLHWYGDEGEDELDDAAARSAQGKIAERQR